jgi:hypothetical protein
MKSLYFCTTLPLGSCVNREMGPSTSCFPVFFYFQGWQEKERKRELQVEGKEKAYRN